MSQKRFILISILFLLFCFSTNSQEQLANKVIGSEELESKPLNESQMKKGIDSYKNSDFIGTIFYMDNVLDQNNVFYTEALFWKSKAYFELKHYKDSQVTLELLFKKGSITTAYYEDARFLYCKIFFMLKEYNDSLLLFNQFVRNSSFSYYKDSAQFWIGECYLQLSELEMAKDAFNKYLIYYPNSMIAIERIRVIEEMILVLNEASIDDFSVVNKAEWLADYIYKEQIDENDKTISKFLDKFTTRDEFFKWLENSSLNLLPITKEDTIIKTDEEIQLSELEKLLIDQIGVDN